MRKSFAIFLSLPLAASLLACVPTDKPPLLFVQSQTVGISATANGTTQTPEFSLGYRDLDIALVPVIGADGGSLTTATEGNSKDAYSVIGQFNVNSTLGANPSANLGKFFATGLAARQVASGFRDKLSKSTTP
jgi:hypothetical protein